MSTHPPLAPSGRSRTLSRRRWASILAVPVIAAGLLGFPAASGTGDVGHAAPWPGPPASSTFSPAPSPWPFHGSSESPSTSPRTQPTYRSTGRFTQVPGRSGVRGTSGELITYRVEVEQGSGVASREFATAIDGTLSHERGWTAGGHWRFQRVSTGDPDLIIRLATPDTVDEQCGAAGFDTEGYVSCRAGQYVLINLDRWYLGVPHVKDLNTYRPYLINHEVGHRLGKGHETCPAPGWRAPVMLQQTLDLDGCRANGWPRSESGKMVSGPPPP